MNKPLAIVLCIVLAALGFAGGRALHRETEAEPSRDVDPNTVSAIITSDLSPIRAAGWESFIGLEPNDLSSSEWARLLADCNGDPFRAQAIVRRWAKMDPAACWERIVEMGDGEASAKMAEIVVTLWAESDPEAAATAAASMGNEDTRRPLLGRVLETALERDPDLGFAIFKTHVHIYPSFPSGVRPWMEADPERACRFLVEARLTGGGWFNNHNGYAGLAWYRSDPEATLAWMRGLDRSARGGVLDAIGEDLEAKGDLAGITELAIAEPSMSARQQIGSHARRLLGREEPALAARWILDHYEPRMAGGEIGNLLRTSARDADPKIFIPFVDELPPGYAKIDAAEQLFANWQKKEPKAALDWLSSLDEFSLSEGVNPTYRSVAPKIAREWLTTAPDSPLASRVRRWLSTK